LRSVKIKLSFRLCIHFAFTFQCGIVHDVGHSDIFLEKTLTYLQLWEG